MRPGQALANQRSYLNLQHLLASRPSCGQCINMRLPASKDQTQSHLHSQQVNAKYISSSTKGLPASHSATTLRTYDHQADSPRNGRFKSTSPVMSQAGSQNVRKEDLRVSSESPTQQARFKLTSAVGLKQPFSGPTAATVCPCNDSTRVSSTSENPQTVKH
jgi:hypothetical protein